MTIAIVAGTGFLGTAIARALVARGERPVQIARGTSPAAEVEGAIVARADRTDEAALAGIFAEHGVTTVIDVLTLTLPTARPLLAAAAGAGARYVMISAVDVIANYGGLMRMETPPLLARPTREDDSMRAALYPYKGNPRRPKGFDDALLDGYDKIPIEEAARTDPRLRAVILRLPAIYGPGDRQGRFTWLAAALDAGGPVRIDARAAAHDQSFVHIDDAGDALARVALSDAADETLHIATDTHRTLADWARAFAVVDGRGAEVETVPPGSGGLMEERAEIMDMRYPLTLDGSAFAARFGPVAQLAEDAAIAGTLAWERRDR